MFDISRIKNAFGSLIGFRQNPDGTSEQVDASNLQTDSGRYYNDVHPLITIENMFSISPDIDNYFNTWLTQKKEASILSTLYDWFARKVKLKSANSLFYSKELFDRIDYDDNKVQSDHLADKVGFLVELRDDTTKIVLTDIKVKTSPSTSNEIAYLSVIKLGEDTNIATNNQYTQTSGGDNIELLGSGKYFIYGIMNDWDAPGVKDCGNTEYINTDFVRISSAYTGQAVLSNYPNLSAGNSNWGFHFKVNAVCDYTQFLIDNKILFADAITKRFGVDILREFAFNPNAQVNRYESNFNHVELIYEVDGDTQSTGGNNTRLGTQYKDSLLAISCDDLNLKSRCMKARNRGVKYRTV